jgi:hypothetical protein
MTLPRLSSNRLQALRNILAFLEERHPDDLVTEVSSLRQILRELSPLQTPFMEPTGSSAPPPASQAVKEFAVARNAVVECFRRGRTRRMAVRLLLRNLIQHIPEASSGSVLLHEPEDHTMRLGASYGLNNDRMRPFRLRVSPETMYAYPVFATQRPKIFTEDELTPHFSQQQLQLHRGRFYVQQMIVPMVRQAASVGLITISHYMAGHSFASRDLRLLQEVVAEVCDELFRFTEPWELGPEGMSEQEMQQLEACLEQVVYLKSKAPYLEVYEWGKSDSTLLLRATVKQLQEHFDDQELTQISRSCLVNPLFVRRAVKRVHPDFDLQLAPLQGAEGPSHLPIGRTHIATLQQKYPEWFQ